LQGDVIVKTLHIQGSRGKSIIIVGEVLENITNYLPDTQVILITDSHIWDLYEQELRDFQVIKIGVGEAAKNLDTVRSVCEQLIELEADRSSFLVGVGGGVVCDVTGFVASIYLRGVRFGFVASTLLAQVDASVGGKNGVNLGGYKNMIGVFNQPEFVVCDIAMLKTLPRDQISNGLAEVVKHAAIADPRLFAYLEGNVDAVLSLDPEVIEKLVYDSVAIKAAIVNRDELEQGERRKLNFGHTLGHAIEKNSHLSHGEAVSVGMVLAAKLSVSHGFLQAGSSERLANLLRNLGLPTHINLDPEALLDGLRKDKKRERQEIHFVFLRDIGQAIVRTIKLKDLQVAVQQFFVDIQ